MTDEIVELCRPQDESEAQIIEAALTKAGLTCRVVGRFPAGAAGESAGMASGPTVYVPQMQLEAARDVLQELKSAQSPFRISSWTCPRCSTEVEAELGCCWNCLYNPSAC